jgi:MoaA/NifB/PqqE/SkfB family radical SAM enzyme
MDILKRKHNVVEVSLSNVCNFGCDYCISESPKFDIKTNPDGSTKIYTDLRYNEKGVMDLQRARKYGLSMGTMSPEEHNKLLREHDLGHMRDDFMDQSLLIKFIREKLPNWIVQVTGGEPLLIPKANEFLKELSKTHKIILLSNISLLSKNMDILDIPSDRMFYRVGFHPERCPVEVYSKNLNILRDHGKSFAVNYVLHPRHQTNGMSRAYVDFLIDTNTPYEITRFSGKWGGVTYPTKELSMQETELLSSHSKSNNFSTDPSIPGNSYMSIFPNGDIYQCSTKVKKLGNIYQDIFMPQWKVPLNACFSNGNACPSVIAQEHIFHNLKWGD